VPRAWPDGRAKLGIRPEDVELEGDLTGELLVFEPQGRDFLVTLRVGGHEVQVLSASRPPGSSTLPLSFPPERLHLFDEEGARLDV